MMNRPFSVFGFVLLYWRLGGFDVHRFSNTVLVKGAGAAVVRGDSEKGVYYITPMPSLESSQTKNHLTHDYPRIP